MTAALALLAAIHGDDALSGDPRSRDSLTRERPSERSDTHSSLLTRLRSGDASAFRDIVAEHYTVLVGFATGMLGDRDAADDVVQETLARVWERRAELRVTTSLRAYLFGAVRHRVLNVVAHEAVAARAVNQLRRDIEAQTFDGDFSTDNSTDAQLLQKALGTLTERRQTAVRLRYVNGLTYPEIGAAMGVSTASAEQLVFHAIRALRAALIGSDPRG
jgi:RNA polymerase sigma-70 factor (ECF subfamily)